jgi:predicted phosphodiesterase
MRILILADNDAFTWTGPSQPVDLVVSCGDVYDPLILTAAKACSAAQILAVKGNHDLPSVFPVPITDLHLQVVTLPNGMRVGGFNGSWKYKPRGNYLYSQDEAAALIGQLPPVDILISHNSPAGVHERDTDVHQGFVALTDYIGRHSPRLLIHGHQHVSRETVVGGTRIVGVYGSMVVEV